MGEPRQRRCCVFQQAIEIVGRADTLDIDGLAFLFGQVSELQNPVHEQLQAGLGRQPPGGCMGREQKSRFFQIGHHIADGRRRQIHGEAFGYGSRANGIAGFHIGFDDAPQNFARTVVQFGKHVSLKSLFPGGFRYAGPHRQLIPRSGDNDL